jgi:hypothetical protein
MANVIFRQAAIDDLKKYGVILMSNGLKHKQTNSIKC